MYLYSSQTTFVFFRYEHPTDTLKELAGSKLPWANVHEAWVWSLLDKDDFASKMLVQHFQVLTEAEMTVLSTQGNTHSPLRNYMPAVSQTGGASR
jgi:hypothetical protein